MTEEEILLRRERRAQKKLRAATQSRYDMIGYASRAQHIKMAAIQRQRHALVRYRQHRKVKQAMARASRRINRKK
jgi:hypothetical protein